MTENAPSSPPLRRKAYSYLRFSTPEQLKGDSRRRQATLAQQYAESHGLELDDGLTFHDLGVSGFRGKNVEKGRLGEFLEAVRTGLVPAGSVLLVEQLDRISRLPPRIALRTLEDICDAGVSVVTLNDGREYTSDSLNRDPMDLLVSILTFMRANEESETKAKRLAQAWEGKRLAIGSRPLTAIMPAWLMLNREAGTIEVISDRAEAVRRIFAMTLQGLGKHKIAETFNQEGLPVWGRGRHWHRTYIDKILNNDAVVGMFRPHRVQYEGGKKLRIPLEPVEGYFPPVIDRGTWASVQALQGNLGGVPRGRQAAAPITNILARLAVCPKCGATMTRVQKGRKSLPSFVCTAAKVRAGCVYKSVRYSAVEERLLRVLPDSIRDREGLKEVEGLEARIHELEDAIYACQRDIEELVDLLLDARSQALVDRLAALESELPAMQMELQLHKDHREVMMGPLVGSRIGRALSALRPAEGAELDRKEINLALRALFSRAVINWPEGTIDLEWQLGGTCRVHYAWTGGPWPPLNEKEA
jgi:DNA invertase Pin-like site-specific DNA recombinase